VTAVGRTPAVGERDPLATWVLSVRAGANVARCDQRGNLLAQRGSIQLHGLGQQAHVDLLDGGQGCAHFQSLARTDQLIDVAGRARPFSAARRAPYVYRFVRGMP
jgi:hypothetical protein